jgi:hypothetical protein
VQISSVFTSTTSDIQSKTEDTPSRERARTVLVQFVQSVEEPRTSFLNILNDRSRKRPKRMIFSETLYGHPWPKVAASDLQRLGFGPSCTRK